MLSFVAGLVNIAGALALGTLTTNVTGHFAFGAEAVTNHDYLKALIFLLYIQFFLFGAFTCNFLVEYRLSRKRPHPSTYPIVIEVSILVLLAIFWQHGPIGSRSSHFLACCLLFAMGNQNALVTKISDSVVRTTHLTGLFTDLGIELSQLFYYKLPEQRAKLYKSIQLRSMIITFFFLGCLAGGACMSIISSYTLLLAAVFLVVAALSDTIRYRYLLLKRLI